MELPSSKTIHTNFSPEFIMQHFQISVTKMSAKVPWTLPYVFTCNVVVTVQVIQDFIRKHESISVRVAEILVTGSVCASREQLCGGYKKNHFELSWYDTRHPMYVKISPGVGRAYYLQMFFSLLLSITLLASVVCFFPEVLQNFSERQILWCLWLVVFHALTLKLSI